MPSISIPSPIAVRALYCLTLLSICAGYYRNAWGLVMMLGSPRTYNIMNLLVGVVPNLAILAAFLLAAARCIGVLVGRFKLGTIATTGLPRALRIGAIVLMAFSIVPRLFALAGALLNHGQDGVGFALLLGSLGGGSALALVIFEASRLLEREVREVREGQPSPRG